MYQSSFIGEPSISVPDGYGGTMLSNDENERASAGNVEEAEAKKSEETGLFGNLFRHGIPGIFGGKSLLGDFKLGTEEILILGAALFLLLSGSRDIECLIILLALLFVK